MRHMHDLHFSKDVERPRQCPRDYRFKKWELYKGCCKALGLGAFGFYGTILNEGIGITGSENMRGNGTISSDDDKYWISFVQH
jgi:hypothetical protein